MNQVLSIFGWVLLVCRCYHATFCGNVECVQGTCEKDACVCNDCYTGPTCELLKNKSPTFMKSSYQITLNEDIAPDQVLGRVTAEDNDDCLEPTCKCKSIVYSILDESVKNTFKIDSETGDIRATQDNLDSKNEYTVVIKASNKSPFDNVYDTTTVYIIVKGSEDRILKRFRRDTAPSKPTFILIQTFPVTNLTTINIGQRLTAQLTITFPTGSTSLGVELFTSEVSSGPVMTICSASVTSNGSSLSIEKIEMTKQEGVNGSVWPYTHFVYNFTNVVNNEASPSTISLIQVTITFDVVMMYSSATVNGSLYYVSAGAEYYNGTEIWVGQLSYMANLATPTPSPTINILGDTALYPGRTAVFDLTIQAPHAYLDLNLGVYTPLNNSGVMSLCIVNRYYVGLSYSCLPTTYKQPTLTAITINSQTVYTAATMSLGTLGNRYYMEPSHTDILEKTISIKIVARANPNLWLGNSYYLGISLTNIPSNLYTAAYPLPSVAAPTLISYPSSIDYNISAYQGISNINLGSAGKILLMINIPAGTELDYTIVASFPSNDSEVCGMVFLQAGNNVPCLDQVTFVTTYSMTSDGYATTSTSVIQAVRHIRISNNTDDDVLQILITFRPINDTQKNPIPKNLQGNVQLKWTGGAGAVKPISFALTDPVSVNINITNMPNFTFQLKGNDGNVSVNGAYQLFFAMRLQPSITYGPTTLEFFMPFNGTIRISMCSVSINYVGKNVLCFNANFMTTKFVWSSKINDTSNYDKLSIPIGVLCSGTPLGVTASLDDEVQMTFNLVVLPHSMNIATATTNINSGMMITSTQIWVGNQPITIVTKPSAPVLSASQYPYIYAQRVDAANNIVFQNDLAIINYVIKISPGIITGGMSLKISSDVTSTDNFGVCAITVKSQGASIPCVIGNLTTTKWTSYSKYNKDATFVFADLLNTGSGAIVNSPAFDENTILIEVIVKFGTSIPASVTVTGLLSFPSSTKTVSTQFTLQTTLSRFNGTVASTEPVFNMFLSPLFTDTQPNITNLGYSEAARSVVSVQLQPNVLQSLKIIFASAPNTLNQMDVISVNILSVGRNIPCLRKGMMSFVVQSRTGSLSKDLTSLDLGTICHRQYLTSTTIEDNKIYIEAVFRIWKLPLNNPTSILVNVLGLLNNDQIYVTRIIVNTSPTTSLINDTNLTAQDINATATVVPTTVPIGSNFYINITLKIPPYSQFKTSSIVMYSPMPAGSDSYCFIGNIVNATGSFGANIGINPNEPLPLTLKSSMNTSQMNMFSVDLGVVQNTATTYRMEQNNYTTTGPEDTISLSIPVQMTDNSAAANAASISFNIGVNFGSIVKNVSLQITVSRTNTEIIDFTTTTNLITSNPIYTSNDPIIVSVQAIMSNLSVLECRNFTIQVAAPPFIQFSGITNSSYSCPGYPIVPTNLSSGGFYFLVPYFFYKENISIVFSMNVIPNLSLTKNRMQSIVTIPIIYACRTLNWPANPLGNKWFNKVDPVVIFVKGQDMNISDCNNDLLLTSNTAIKDCAISAYMSPNPSYDALKIRSNSNSYWAPHIRTGQYNKLRYIDIRFGTLTTVSKVIVTSTIANKPQSINIYGTMDGRSFNFYKNFRLVYSGNTASVILSVPAFTFRGIRVGIDQALFDDQLTGMNLDLFGCAPQNVTDPATFDPCTVKPFGAPTVQLPDFYYRGYLYVSPYLFVCDEIASQSNSLDTYPRCFRSNGSSTWEDLGSQIGKVVGYDSANQIIYGISADLTSYIMSEDNGLTWTVLNGGGWKLIKVLFNVPGPTVMPWTTDASFSSSVNGTACTTYTTGSFNFCFDGIYSGTTRIYTWNRCCSV